VKSVVKYTPALVKRLQQILRSAFSQPSLILATPTKRGTGFHVVLAGNSKTAHMDDGPEQEVAEIVVNGRHSNFWFGLDAAFSMVAVVDQFELLHVAIGVFHNIAGDLVPFFRADWDKNDATGHSKHAQPHWHFVQRPARIECIVRDLWASTIETPREFTPESQSQLFAGLVDCGMFHFAMTSLWEKTEDPPYIKRIFESEDFPEWFDNLTKYIASEIGLIIKHTPIGDAPAVVEFVP
jgi:hypothetical protein